MVTKRVARAAPYCTELYHHAATDPDTHIEREGWWLGVAVSCELSTESTEICLLLNLR